MASVAFISAVIGVLTSCSINVFFLELIVKEAPHSSFLLTLCHFIATASYGFIINYDKQRVVPLREYIVLVSLYFISNVTNNLSLDYKLSVPLHTVIKSGSLLTNMLMGVVILKRKYSKSKLFSVLASTVGIIICTISSYIGNQSAANQTNDEQESVNYLIGLFLVFFALFIGSYLGIFQEKIYLKYGKHPDEMLYYLHILALPVFLMRAQNLSESFNFFSQSPSFQYLPIPRLWIYISLNAITQLLCIRSVFYITCESSSLTVTFVTTVRKFLSLIFSVIYFNNLFTVYHWLGSALVFIGTLFFADVHLLLCKQTGKTDKKAR